MNRIAKSATTVVLSGGLGLAVLGLAAGTAHADGPYQWCPGDDLSAFGSSRPNWNVNVCHTYYTVPTGLGNVSPGIWADSPPPSSS
jgi:hypothetical protein